MATVTIEMQNRTCSQVVWCWVIGLSIDNNNKLMLMSSDGITPYYPPCPADGTTCQPLPKDCSIPLGPPGQSVFLQVPHIAGCRIYFSIDKKLTFALNPGPNGACIVEPSCTNQSDPNIDIIWDFVELTFNENEVFANISYVDFVTLPVSATLVTTDGRVNHVSGMPANGLRNICSALKAQSAMDGQAWKDLIVKGSDGKVLRVLSPNNGICCNPAMFQGYFDSYVNQVWQQYGHQRIDVNTQAQWGHVTGTISGDQFVIDNETFDKPSAADIFSCSTGPFGGGSAEKMCIIPRLAAAFNRTTLLTSLSTPDPAGPASYYKTAVTNHYCRIVHEQLLDGRGYTFPYDDVAADGGPDQCGAVYDSKPKLLTFGVGGNGAYIDCSSPIQNI